MDFELTSEQATMSITKERFDIYHQKVGEDFCDQEGSIVNVKVLGGFLIAKNPELTLEILDVLNSQYGDALGLCDIYVEHFEDAGFDMFYSLFAELADLTIILKKRINEVFIQNGI